MSEQTNIANPGADSARALADTPACSEVVEINCFAYTAEGFSGHVKISGVPLAKAVKRLGELSKAFTAAGMTPREGNSELTTAVVKCPEHGAAKVKPSQYGSGVYCAAKVGDGYCRWKSQP